MSDDHTDPTPDAPAPDPQALATRPIVASRPGERPRGDVPSAPSAPAEPAGPSDDDAPAVDAGSSATDPDDPDGREDADATDDATDDADDTTDDTTDDDGDADTDAEADADDDADGRDHADASDADADTDDDDDDDDDAGDTGDDDTDDTGDDDTDDTDDADEGGPDQDGPDPDDVPGGGADGAPDGDHDARDGADDVPADEVEDGPDARPEVDPADAARRRLLRAMVPRATRGQLLAAVMCALLGFGVVVQARQTRVASLASLRESELVAVLDNVTQESARLEAQQRSLQDTLESLRSSSDRAPAARQAAEERVRVLGVLAGTLPATGPGIDLLVPDVDLKINATELLETVQELRDAGAEAMQIGSVRIVASTALVDDPAGIKVDGTVLSPPYRLLAIGDPQTLAAALEIPGGVLETFRGKGVEGVVTTKQSLTVSALRPSRTPQYARPAPAP